MNLATVAHFWDLKPKTLSHWYKEHISDFHLEKQNGSFAGQSAYIVDHHTAELKKEQVIHIHKAKNIGSHMNMDEKMIGKRYCTILSNAKTGKIAMLVESMNPKILSSALSTFELEVLQSVKHICTDMSPLFKKLCTDKFTKATLTVDKFHVMKHVLDFVQGLRISAKNEITKQDNQHIQGTLWTKKQLLTKSKYMLYKVRNKWNEDEQIIAKHLFKLYPTIHSAYQYIERFRQWYDISNRSKSRMWIEKHLEQWVEDIEIEFPEASRFIRKMLLKHEAHIINYFQEGLTNSKAENLNGKIKRFIGTNYGLRNRDFFYYRVQVYFT